MEITLSNKIIRIDWIHQRRGIMVEQDITNCRISECINHTRYLNHISEGISYCNEKDNFSKEIGRKISLTRALINGNFSKSDRKYIWDAYRARVKQ